MTEPALAAYSLLVAVLARQEPRRAGLWLKRDAGRALRPPSATDTIRLAVRRSAAQQGGFSGRPRQSRGSPLIRRIRQESRG
jgi:hypothetical protein